MYVARLVVSDVYCYIDDVDTMKVSRNGTISLPADWRRQAGNPAQVGLRVDVDGNLIVFPIGVGTVFGKYAHLAASSDDVRRQRDAEIAIGE